MKYKKVVDGIFLSRPNRFIANVIVDGREEVVHVKNTGRCRELLVPGAKVYLSVSDNTARKTKYDLIAVEKDCKGKITLINMDSQIPNDIAFEWLKKGNIFSTEAVIKREVTYKKSRFDLFVEDGNQCAFVEVKGVTLEEDGVVSFPDAPTERGIKHINELVLAKKEGYESFVLFVVQMKGANYFTPAKERHPEFAKTLQNARDNGVNILAVDCVVNKDEIYIDDYVEVKL